MTLEVSKFLVSLKVSCQKGQIGCPPFGVQCFLLVVLFHLPDLVSGELFVVGRVFEGVVNGVSFGHENSPEIYTK